MRGWLVGRERNFWCDEMFYILIVVVLMHICQDSLTCTLQIDESYCKSHLKVDFEKVCLESNPSSAIIPFLGLHSKQNFSNALRLFSVSLLISLREKTLAKVIKDLSFVVSSILISWDLCRAWQYCSAPSPGHTLSNSQSIPTSLALLTLFLPHHCLAYWILEVFPLTSSSLS